jgi:hypothetical protein
MLFIAVIIQIMCCDHRKTAGLKNFLDPVHVFDELNFSLSAERKQHQSLQRRFAGK